MTNVDATLSVLDQTAGCPSSDMRAHCEQNRPQLAEAHGTDPADLDSSLWDVFSKTATTYAEREALVSVWQQSTPTDHGSSNFPPSEGQKYVRWTYQELHDKSEELASALQRLGCRPGMRLAAILWNSAEWTLLLWAAARLGLVYAPVDPRVPEDTKKVLRILEPEIVVIQDENALVCTEGQSVTVSRSQLCIQCTETNIEGWLGLANFRRWEKPKSSTAESRPRGCSSPHASAKPAEKADRVNLINGKKSPQRQWTNSSSSGAGSITSSGTQRSVSAASQSSQDSSSRGKLVPKVAKKPAHLVKVTSLTSPVVSHTSKYEPSDPALIIFTSGTTGTPKGCSHTNENLMAQTDDYDPNVDKSFVERWLVHTPVSHIFAINNALRAWRYGGCVVFPSKSFNPDATINALLHEQCTIMSATPTLARMLLSYPSYPPPESLNLSIVTMAATKITPEDTRLCTEGLGAKDAIQAYGMCEGAPLVSWTRGDEMLCNGHHEGVGKALPGVKLRICQPGTRKVVSAGEEGELHVSGPSVISKYLFSDDKDPFYTDSNGRWFRTGDRATIDELGVVRILGRYKELIIRGGENITPTVIEEALSSISGVQAWVVGVQDAAAGEVPVAVAKLPNGASKSHLFEKASGLGSRYALVDIYTLDELGLESVPMTSLGKVKKTKLREFVNKFREPKRPEGEQLNSSSGMTDRENDTEQMLIAVWESLTGSHPPKDVRLSDFADSITMLRYCDAVFRSSGKRLYFQDVLHHETLRQQIKLLSTRSQGEVPQDNKKLGRGKAISGCTLSPEYPEASWPSVTKPKSQGTLPQLSSDELMQKARKHVDSLGFFNSPIEDILPIRESLHRMVDGLRPQSFHVQMVFRLSQASSNQICRGVEKAALSRSMLRSALFQPADGGLYHILLGPSHELWDQLIQVVEVESEWEAQQHWQDESQKSLPLGLMFKAEVIVSRNGGAKYLSMLYNHSVMDALSLYSMHKDVDSLIKNMNASTTPVTPFKLFADLFTNYESSVPAQEAVSFHVRRLRGVSRLKQAFWPRQRAPGWMIMSDADSPLFDIRNRTREEVWGGKWPFKSVQYRHPRIGRVVYVSGLKELKDQGIPPSMFTKAAIVLFNVLKTGSSHALFNSWESGRSWPFVTPWMEAMMPPAMNVDGPMVEWIPNLVEVFGNETVADFLRRVVADSDQLKKYEHAPWRKVVKALRDEGDLAIDASFRQSFVWDMSLGMSVMKKGQNIFRCLEPVARFDWADSGLFWNAFQIDQDNIYFVGSWDTAQMNDEEMEENCDLLADVMRQLGEEGSWERAVGNVFPAK